jgi:putative Mn2+ efflux pump MntP
MGFGAILIIAVGLGMDALSVAVGIGGARRERTWGPTLRLALSFGLFQFFMPVAGWLAGRTVADVIAGYDHWIAFALLAYVGGRMIRESFRGGDAAPPADPTQGWTLLMLSVATSIDALAVGLSFAFLKTPILFPSAVIGVVCFLMTVAGMRFGERLGRLVGRRMEMVGGLVLIGIGLKILFEHLAG